MKINADAVIVGTGVAGLFAALSLPRELEVVMITKADLESSDSFLAQGGICVLRDEEDYDSYFEDTMRAGHYENRRESVDIMIRGSRQVIRRLVGYGVEFERDGEGGFVYTREGAHSRPRILFHEDVTGREITSHLLEQAKKLENVTLYEYTEMTDIIEEMGRCAGVLARRGEERIAIRAPFTILASGGIGGRYRHSTNFPHLTGDAIDIAKKHGIRLEHLDYVQIHPTTLYSRKPGRRFLISESVRGEGALLLDRHGERFVDELLPRDVVTKAILEQMKKECDKGVDPRGAGAALFYGRHLGGQREQDLHAGTLRGRGDELQWSPRSQPSCQQLPSGEPCLCREGGGGYCPQNSPGYSGHGSGKNSIIKNSKEKMR